MQVKPKLVAPSRRLIGFFVFMAATGGAGFYALHAGGDTTQLAGHNNASRSI